MKGAPPQRLENSSALIQGSMQNLEKENQVLLCELCKWLHFNSKMSVRSLNRPGGAQKLY